MKVEGSTKLAKIPLKISKFITFLQDNKTEYELYPDQIIWTVQKIKCTMGVSMKRKDTSGSSSIRQWRNTRKSPECLFYIYYNAYHSKITSKLVASKWGAKSV